MSKKHYYGRAAAGLSFSEGVFSTTTASATGFSGRSALTTYESDEREYEREYASAIRGWCAREALFGARRHGKGHGGHTERAREGACADAD